MSATLLGYQQKLSNQYQALSTRDRLALKLLTGFLGALLLIYGLLLPALQYRSDARTSYQQQQQLLSWLESKRPEIRALSGKPQASAVTGSALTLVNNSAKKFKLAIKRLQPETSGDLRVWMENVNFDTTVQWLHHLQEKGLSVSEISVDQQAPGKINMRATFTD